MPRPVAPERIQFIPLQPPATYIHCTMSPSKKASSHRFQRGHQLTKSLSRNTLRPATSRSLTTAPCIFLVLSFEIDPSEKDAARRSAATTPCQRNHSSLCTSLQHQGLLTETSFTAQEGPEGVLDAFPIIFNQCAASSP
jgi:hypothetical protein